MKVKGKKKNSRWRKWIQQKRKKNQRKYWMEKPSLKKRFIHCFTIGLCIAIATCFLGTVGVVNYYREVQKREFYLYTNTFADGLIENYERISKYVDSKEEKLELWRTQVRWNLNTKKGGLGYDGYLYDVDSREIFVEPQQQFHVLLIDNYGTEQRISVWYECDTELVKDVLDVGKKTEEECDVFPEIVLKDMYIRNGKFIPGKMYLQLYNEDDIEIVKEYDYTPENTTGYQHIVIEGNEQVRVIGPTWWWEIEENPTTQKMINDYIKNEYAYDDTGIDIWDEDTSIERNTFWGWQNVFNELITIDDGKEYMLVMAVDINLFKSYGIWVVVAYSLVLLLTVIISYAFAYRSYMVRLNHYQLDEYRRQTTNAMAHDLKTPLMAISGYADNLRANVHTEKKDYYADVILENVQYMNQMIGNILELAKVENVRWVPDKEDVDLKSMTEDILKQYEILTTDKKVLVDLEGEATIQADKTLMTQALRNLISNAMKYAIKGSVIHIQMNHESFEIRNEMQGELEVSVEELWKPFVKGDNSRNEQKGTGIGLTIVKNITDVHGFELVLQSEEKEFIAQIWM